MIRVLRLMEYIYPDAEAAMDDMARWQVQGVKRMSSKQVIRSTVLPMESIREDEWTEQDLQGEDTP